MDDQHLARARGGVGVHLLSLGIWLQQALWPPSHGARGEDTQCHVHHGMWVYTVYRIFMLVMACCASTPSESMN